MFLRKNSLYVWHVAWKDYLDYKDMFWSILSLKEKNRASQLLLSVAQHQFIVTRGLLRILIGYVLNQAPHTVSFHYTAGQKPHIVNTQGLEFNISHTLNNVLYGFCLHTKIGLDIEEKGRKINIAGLSNHYFSTQENAQLASMTHHEKSEAFLKGWSQKEAISKAYGLGLQMRFRQIEVNVYKGEPGLLQIYNPAFQHLQFLLYSIPVPKNCYAVIAAQTSEKILNIFYMASIDHLFINKMISIL